MTIKQFAYVGFGVIMAVVLYYAPVNILIKILFIPLFGASGVVIAFLPVEGRPIDIMAGNFLKAIFSPNQFIYQKMGRPFSFAVLPATKISSTNQQTSSNQQAGKNLTPEKNKEQQLQVMLQSNRMGSQNKLDEREESFIKSLTTANAIPAPFATASNPPMPQLQVAAPMVPTPVPVTQNIPAPDSPTEQEDNLNKELAQVKKEDAGNPKAALLERQVQALHFQRQQLEQQLQQLQAQMSTKQQTTQSQQNVHNIPKEMTKSAGLPHVSDTPNVIIGIVKDSRGNVLPGMLVEVKDKAGNPVRAFKTNQLGQFVSATPLASGTYTIEIDDPKKQHNFDIIQIIASNQILLPFEITSHDAREELRKELFN
jgi:hypothetical protein